jgi:hypothetical protein
MADIFSNDATAAQLDKLKDLPPEQGGIGIAVENGDVGVQGAASKELGKGWRLTAAGSWFVTKGYAAAAWVGWKGKS